MWHHRQRHKRQCSQPRLTQPHGKLRNQHGPDGDWDVEPRRMETTQKEPANPDQRSQDAIDRSRTSTSPTRGPRGNKSARKTAKGHHGPGGAEKRIPSSSRGGKRMSDPSFKKTSAPNGEAEQRGENPSAPPPRLPRPEVGREKRSGPGYTRRAENVIRTGAGPEPGSPPEEPSPPIPTNQPNLQTETNTEKKAS